MWRCDRLPLLAVLLALGLGVGGCGRRLVPAQGKVTVDGRPLEGVIVRAFPTSPDQGEGGVGRTGPDGVFRLLELRSKVDGVAPGSYKLVLCRFLNASGAVLPENYQGPPGTDCLQGELSSAATSPLSCTFPDPTGTVNVALPPHLVHCK